MRRLPKYFLAMLLPLIVLLTRPLTPAAVLMFGREIRLSTEPVDPRDIFRGDYVTLRFSIEEPGESLLSLSDEVKDALSAKLEHDSAAYLYVTLEPDGDGIWQPVAISLTAPAAGVYLRARVRFNDYTLDYGDYMRRYYVRENTGRELEDAARNGKLTALVKVWRGRAALTSVEMRDRYPE